MNNNTCKPKAFFSCSLRKEDEKFVDLIEQITKNLGFDPIGTIGQI